jgi:PKD repeat protein
MIKMKKYLLFISGIFSILLTISCGNDPVADFSSSDTVKVGEYITFTNISTNTENCTWDFGDGTTSDIFSPTHKFEKPDTYTVTLKAKGKGGSNSTSKTISVTGMTYSFLNNTSHDLSDFCSFYYDRGELVNLVEHGTLAIGEETDPVITDKNVVNFIFSIGSNDYISARFLLYNNMHNLITIPDSPILENNNTSEVIDNVFLKL